LQGGTIVHIRRSAQEIAANRARYEDHQKKGLEFAPTALPGNSEKPAPAIAADQVLHREVIPGGWYWATRVRKNEVLRVSLDEGFSTVTMVAWNAAEPTERLNLPDTVKVQWTTGLGKGRVILSDMGKVMFSVTQDSSGAHDCLMGGSTASSNARKYAGANIAFTYRFQMAKCLEALELSSREGPRFQLRISLSAWNCTSGPEPGMVANL
jgi:uncharacterized protein YcgI (DUF1989 family)